MVDEGDRKRFHQRGESRGKALKMWLGVGGVANRHGNCKGIGASVSRRV